MYKLAFVALLSFPLCGCGGNPRFRAEISTGVSEEPNEVAPGNIGAGGQRRRISNSSYGRNEVISFTADVTPEQQLTTAAWDAYNAGNYDRAIVLADRCISEYHAVAVEMQARLAAQNVVLPVGSVSEREKEDIFVNGPLNDVGTCLFIRGKSAEKLGLTAIAANAYNEAAELGHARCWDPRGWFWSPAEASRMRLSVLR